ncbi:MAG: hypothetical protein KGL74_11510 [Elusimicrobia bacterium]|nr:hypothetical protein [Elusimicrobiota bacterium]
MNPSIALVAAAVFLALPGRAEPPAPAPPSQFGAADQKLIDRYTAALAVKFGGSKWAVAGGSLTATTPSGGVAVSLDGVKSEDEVETRILAALKPVEKKEAGEAKTPVYFAGASADALFKDGPAKLDLAKGEINFPDSSQAKIVFSDSGNPARRVVIRRGDDGALTVTMDQADYSFVEARVAGGKSQRDGVKKGPASVYFEFNVWMQRNLKLADGRAAKEKAPKLSDGGYRHPSFEKLMSQVQGGLTGDKLAAAFDNAGAQAPANLDARAQAAREMAASGYGGAARWKINSNGKYADANGNLTLLVRANGADGKIEETPVLIKKNAKGGWDLAAAVAPVTKILLAGDVAGARAQAYETAAAATPADAAAEVARHPLAALGMGIMGFGGTRALTNAGPAKTTVDAAAAGVATRKAAAVKKEDAAVADVCGGKTPCAPAAVVQRPPVRSATNAVIPANVGCVINMQPLPDQKNMKALMGDLPEPWMALPPHASGSGSFTAAGCTTGRDAAALERAKTNALNRLNSRVSCEASVRSTTSIDKFVTFQTPAAGVMGACAEAVMQKQG